MPLIKMKDDPSKEEHDNTDSLRSTFPNLIGWNAMCCNMNKTKGLFTLVTKGRDK
jgi:hypothetical protein